MASSPIPKGFLLAGVHAGIKKSGYDLALIVSESPATAAGVYTKNKAKAAPVLWDMAHDTAPIRAIVINSKNANALTGLEGRVNAERTAAHAARAIGCKKEETLLASTGVIGQQLPMDAIMRGIDLAVPKLKNAENYAPEAIMTTDKFKKTAKKTIVLGGKRVTFYAMGKGAGMIHPDMATLLVFILTDLAVTRSVLIRALKDAVAQTFNSISVDGDTSTNDTVIALANGRAGNTYRAKEYKTLVSALTALCLEIALLMVKDGEGATKVIALTVNNAKTNRDARAVAKTIATSPLVKTAFYGQDANWGRIAAAVGRAGVRFETEKLSVTLNGTMLLKKGAPVPFNEKTMKTKMKQPMQTLVVDLGYTTNTRAQYYFSDLTHDYVSLNADYRS